MKFLMDDCMATDRITRKADLGELHCLKGDTILSLVQYETDTTLSQPKQGFSKTKFHKGFMRRQADSIRYLQHCAQEVVPYLKERSTMGYYSWTRCYDMVHNSEQCYTEDHLECTKGHSMLALWVYDCVKSPSGFRAEAHAMMISVSRRTFG
mmetsp:Transcript_5537/g.14626  ORF Transcript_5537/g.14626 Transcript_5537/m.14626 type:complete len:152 (-) Transcript_5537:288-743(-)|eukprot:CAMPEP_0115856016 /NCGR_PEP_ID=MMETSP0287-20121206/14836_1 /TAXON_ID=412157 /ORGANISM="Chrysochromulina rotalis, Strain UIO044" /LENGTH=151 /DNA_ID=CAMNT_0003310179 /DNA_START=151 /DNA_END=606 /DNA_ORIENTATION=+